MRSAQTSADRLHTRSGDSSADRASEPNAQEADVVLVRSRRYVHLNRQYCLRTTLIGSKISAISTHSQDVVTPAGRVQAAHLGHDAARQDRGPGYARGAGAGGGRAAAEAGRLRTRVLNGSSCSLPLARASRARIDAASRNAKVAPPSNHFPQGGSVEPNSQLHCHQTMPTNLMERRDYEFNQSSFGAQVSGHW